MLWSNTAVRDLWRFRYWIDHCHRVCRNVSWYYRRVDFVRSACKCLSRWFVPASPKVQFCVSFNYTRHFIVTCIVWQRRCMTDLHSGHLMHSSGGLTDYSSFSFQYSLALTKACCSLWSKVRRVCSWLDDCLAERVRVGRGGQKPSFAGEALGDLPRTKRT